MKVVICIENYSSMIYVIVGVFFCFNVKICICKCNVWQLLFGVWGVEWVYFFIVSCRYLQCSNFDFFFKERGKQLVCEGVWEILVQQVFKVGQIGVGFQ